MVGETLTIQIGDFCNLTGKFYWENIRSLYKRGIISKKQFFRNKSLFDVSENENDLIRPKVLSIQSKNYIYRKAIEVNEYCDPLRENSDVEINHVSEDISKNEHLLLSHLNHSLNDEEMQENHHVDVNFQSFFPSWSNEDAHSNLQESQIFTVDVSRNPLSEIVMKTEDNLRGIAEKCDRLESFQIFLSNRCNLSFVSTPSLLHYLNDEFTKLTKISFYLSPENVFNSGFVSQRITEYSDCALFARLLNTEKLTILPLKIPNAQYANKIDNHVDSLLCQSLMFGNILNHVTFPFNCKNETFKTMDLSRGPHTYRLLENLASPLFRNGLTGNLVAASKSHLPFLDNNSNFTTFEILKSFKNGAEDWLESDVCMTPFLQGEKNMDKPKIYSQFSFVFADTDVVDIPFNPEEFLNSKTQSPWISSLDFHSLASVSKPGFLHFPSLLKDLNESKFNCCNYEFSYFNYFHDSFNSQSSNILANAHLDLVGINRNNVIDTFKSCLPSENSMWSISSGSFLFPLVYRYKTSLEQSRKSIRKYSHLIPQTNDSSDYEELLIENDMDNLQTTLQLLDPMRYFDLDESD